MVKVILHKTASPPQTDGSTVFTRLRWYGQVMQKEDSDWVNKCMDEVEGSRPRGRRKRTWKEVVQKDCQAHKVNMEDAMHRGWMMIRIGE